MREFLILMATISILIFIGIAAGAQQVNLKDCDISSNVVKKFEENGYVIFDQTVSHDRRKTLFVSPEFEGPGVIYIENKKGVSCLYKFVTWDEKTKKYYEFTTELKGGEIGPKDFLETPTNSPEKTEFSL